MPNALPLIFSGFRSATLQVDRDRDPGGGRRHRRAGPLPHRRPEGPRLPPDGRRRAAGGRARPAWSTCLLAVVQRYVVSPGLTGRGAGRPRSRGGHRTVQGNTPLDVDIPSRHVRWMPANPADQPARSGTVKLHQDHPDHRHGGGPDGHRCVRQLRWRPARHRRQLELGRRRERHHQGRLGRLPRERPARRDLRRRPRGQGRQGHEEAQHRRPRGLHPGAPGRVDRPDPRVHRRADASTSTRRPTATDSEAVYTELKAVRARHPDRARQVRGRGQGRAGHEEVHAPTSWA